MAKISITKNNFAPQKQRKKRKGVHAKSLNSKIKSGKLYKKRYRGQGR